MLLPQTICLPLFWLINILYPVTHDACKKHHISYMICLMILVCLSIRVLWFPVCAQESGYLNKKTERFPQIFCFFHSCNAFIFLQNNYKYMSIFKRRTQSWNKDNCDLLDDFWNRSPLWQLYCNVCLKRIFPSI
jgi:hypothetical protein